MTIDNRMLTCRDSLARSIESMQRSFAEIDAAYRSMASENRKLAHNAASLGATVKRIETDLLRYDHELSGIKSGVGELGDKSRRLAAIMDDYLTGRTPRRHARAA